jgi:molecular chaperone DnaK
MPKEDAKFVVGIDLGTTYSCVAYLNGGEPQVIPNLEGERTTPSVVAFTPEGHWLVGLDAGHQAVLNPKGTVFSIKRFIGKKFEDPETQKDLTYIAYDLIAAENGDIRVKLGATVKSPEEISAIILQKIKQDVEKKTGEKVTHAVITVPAYFNDSQRQGTKDAGKIAGLEVLRIINEPTAAALAYDLDAKKNQKIVIYDLGGGTFDLTILELLNGLYRVLSTSGDTHLGGNDFDQVIMEWALNKFSSENNVDLRSQPVALQRLKEAAEKAKCALSSVTATELNLPFITQGPAGPMHLNYGLTRADYEALVAPLVERTLEPCRRALKDANLSTSDLEEVILVGGMTRTPKVREVVKRFFNREPNIKVNPDEAVALGAAIQAGIITGNIKDALLLDVTPLSLGVETIGGVFSTIIPRNTTVPTKMSKLYTTVKDGQTSVNVRVFQGESKVSHQNKALGYFSFLGLPSTTAGNVKIEVTFAIDSNGIVQVTAKNVETGKQQQMKVSATSGLTKEEVEALTQTAKGRVIHKTAPPEAKTTAVKPASVTSKAVAAPPPPGPAFPVPGLAPGGGPAASPSPFQPPPERDKKTEGGAEGEFLTGDMIDSLLSDESGPK